MRRKKEIAINTHLWLPIVGFVVFLLLCILYIGEGAVGGAIVSAFFVLISLFVFLTSPMYYVFTNKEIEIVYLWGQKEEIRWIHINNITLFGGWLTRGDGAPHYHINYPAQKRLFFMTGDISKTRKTKRLFKNHYGRKIE
jgi:Mn2+/Fe2+ NRAMP family transporter